jgi:hypothetical protein
MHDTHPPIFSALLLEHENETILSLARSLADPIIVLTESKPKAKRPVRKPVPSVTDFGGMDRIDKHSPLL